MFEWKGRERRDEGTLKRNKDKNKLVGTMGTTIQGHWEAWLRRDLGRDQPEVGRSWEAQGAQGPQAPESLRARASRWTCD